MSDMERPWGIYGKAAMGLLFIGIAISLVTYLYYTSYVIIYSWESLPAGIKELPIPFFTPTRNLLALISVAISVLVVFSVLVFLGRGAFSRISPSKERESYSVYAAVFIAMMILISLISSGLFPSNVTYESIVLNFSEQIGVITLTFLLQFVPITIFTAAIASRSKSSAKDLLLGHSRLAGRNASIVFILALISDAAILYAVNGFSSYPEWLILFAASNIIYLKFGLWRAYLANFLYSSMLVISYAVMHSYALSIAFEILIFAWMLIGFLILTNAGMASYARRREEEIKSRLMAEEKPPEAPGPEPGVQEGVTVEIPDRRVRGKMKLWVRGGCPSCGNPTFSSDKNATLSCLKCGREIGTDEVHPHNLEIRNGRIIVAMRKDSNEDLYS